MMGISNRAQAAMDAVEHYPAGDVREWAERNWNEAVCPFMDEFIAAVKNRGAQVDAGYFVEMSPAFLFTDMKAMHGMAEGMRRKSARVKSEIMSAVIQPYGGKWMELISAIQTRIGDRELVGSFQTKLLQVADAVKFMFVQDGLESQESRFWELRCEMIDVWGRIRNKACASTTSTGATRTRYPKDDEAIQVLREGLRRSRQASYQGMSNREIMLEVAKGSHGPRMTRGKIISDRGVREKDPGRLSNERAAVQWGNYLSEYRQSHA